MGRGALAGVLTALGRLEADVGRILATHEASPARLMTLEASYDRVEGLSLSQDEMFRESLRALEVGLFRAAHVLAWAGFIDFLHNLLLPTHHTALVAHRPKWPLGSAEDLREQSDFAVIEAARVIGVYNKTTMKALHGLLNKRNESAHPSDFFPDLNQSLGYISEVLGRIEKLKL